MNNIESLSGQSHMIFNDLEPRIINNFIDFHRSHPHVYDLFKTYAYQIREKGITHYGSKAIMERIRWHVEIDTASGDFKINNNYSSCYARLLLLDDPSFTGFFETRHKVIPLEIH